MALALEQLHRARLRRPHRAHQPAGSLLAVGAETLFARLSFQYGAHRFEEFVRRAGFTEAVTAARLRELVDAGILERRPYRDPGQRSRHDYYLTDKGRDLFPAVIALTRWSDKWVRPDGGRVAFTHANCGAPIEAEVHCAHGHRVEPQDVEASPRRRSGQPSPTIASR